MKKHGHTSRKGKSRTYTSWGAMKSRCLNPRNARFNRYGGRGIQVCERWLQFENFLEDMGERPANTTIDRKDNDGNYESDNCRWGTKEQQISTRSPRPAYLTDAERKNRQRIQRRKVYLASSPTAGMGYTPEARAKMSAAQSKRVGPLNSFYGRKHSPESIAKMSVPKNRKIKSL